MKNYKKFRNWVIVSLTLSIIIFSVFLTLLVVVFPKMVQLDIGPPGENLHISQKVLLSARLAPRLKEILKKTNESGSPRTFLVESGSSAQAIASALESMELINREEDLILYWQYKDLDRFVREGVYLIEPSSTLIEIGDLLASGETGFTQFSFLAGWRKEEIDHLLVESRIITQSREPLLRDCIPPLTDYDYRVEGFLFPGSYFVPDDLPDKEVYCLFVDRFFSTMPDDYLDQITEQGLDLYQAVTLASIIEKELVIEGEAERIAGVFYNRLLEGMPLQSDPTVQYAVASQIGGPDWWDIEITQEDLNIDSPFNTYLIDGLPPAPICNPSATAFRAVSAPETHDYLYFRSACDQSGTHIFLKTYQEHLEAACP